MLLAQAAHAQRNGQDQRALALYRSVLALDPTNFSALASLGVAATRNGDLAGGCTLLESAVRARPDSVEAWMALGNACARAGSPERAADAFGHVVRLRPGLAAGHLNLGNALRRSGRADDALAALRSGVALDPTLVAGHFNLGLALDECGDHAAAESAFSEALRRDADHDGARTGLGNALMHLGRTAEALACFDQVMRKSPGFPGAYHNVGVALQTLRRDAEAIVAFRTALSESPANLDARNNLIVSLIRCGLAADALAECEAYERRAPADPRALAYRAAALLELGRRDEAAALLDFVRLAVTRMIATPPGFESMQAFNAALVRQIDAHASLEYEPAGKSTHGGSQTGEFAHGSAGAAAAMRGAIVEAVRAYMTELRDALPAHPFVAALPTRWRLATWAVSLRSQGYQGPHFHPDGRVSGVYYVAVPDVVATATDGSGGLEFGRTQDAIGGDASPLLHVVQPQEGLMVLFPSYFYHRTLPFASTQPRISIAFDVLPGT